MTWESKAHSIISELCLAEYRKANPKGQKRHKPYTVPSVARELVDCLGRGDEATAKAIFHRLALIPESARD